MSALLRWILAEIADLFKACPNPAYYAEKARAAYRAKARNR